MVVGTTIDDTGILGEQGDVMCRHDDGRPRMGHLTQQLQNAGCCLRVQITGWLVGNDNLRFVQDCTSDGYALLFTARELMGITVGKLFHLDILQHILDALFYLVFLTPSRSTKNKLQVVVNGTVAQQLEILEDNTHLTTQSRDIFTLQPHHIVIQHDSGLGFIDIQFKVERLQQRALTCANTSDDIDELALVNVEVNIFEHQHAIVLINLRLFIIYKHNTLLLNAEANFSLFIFHFSLHLALGLRFASLLVPVGIVALLQFSSDIFYSQSFLGQHDQQVV